MLKRSFVSVLQSTRTLAVLQSTRTSEARRAFREEDL